MKKLVGALIVLMMLAAPTHALDTRELLSLVAMPLAVAAVSELAGVPQKELANVVYRLNQANVPPTQFVQIVRYVPAALVVEEPHTPTFLQFIDEETSRGIGGPALVTSIDRHLVTTYDVRPVMEPEVHRTLFVLQDGYAYRGYVPASVISRMDLGRSDPVALALMPLAMAAVADLAGVPTAPLVELVATLNHARVSPAQFVQVMRYVPVVLVDENGYEFVTYVRTEVARGVTGQALVTLMERRLIDYGIPATTMQLVDTRPIVPYYAESYFPPVVRERVARDVAHPHGGPPGQLKRELGLQTGAEVVHGTDRAGGRASSADRQAAPKQRGSDARVGGVNGEAPKRKISSAPKAQGKARSDRAGSRSASRPAANAIPQEKKAAPSQAGRAAAAPRRNDPPSGSAAPSHPQSGNPGGGPGNAGGGGQGKGKRSDNAPGSSKGKGGKG